MTRELERLKDQLVRDLKEAEKIGNTESLIKLGIELLQVNAKLGKPDPILKKKVKLYQYRQELEIDLQRLGDSGSPEMIGRLIDEINQVDRALRRLDSPASGQPNQAGGRRGNGRAFLQDSIRQNALEQQKATTIGSKQAVIALRQEGRALARKQQQLEATARYKRDRQKQQIRNNAQPPAYRLGNRDPLTGNYIATAPNGGTRKAAPLFNSGQSQDGTLKTSYGVGGRILLDAKNVRPQRRRLVLEENPVSQGGFILLPDTDIIGIEIDNDIFESVTFRTVLPSIYEYLSVSEGGRVLIVSSIATYPTYTFGARPFKENFLETDWSATVDLYQVDNSYSELPDINLNDYDQVWDFVVYCPLSFAIVDGRTLSIISHPVVTPDATWRQKYLDYAREPEKTLALLGEWRDPSQGTYPNTVYAGTRNDWLRDFTNELTTDTITAIDGYNLDGETADLNPECGNGFIYVPNAAYATGVSVGQNVSTNSKGGFITVYRKDSFA